MAVLVATFFGSLGVWLCSYWYLLDPFKQKSVADVSDEDVLEVQQRTLYSWFGLGVPSRQLYSTSIPLGPARKRAAQRTRTPPFLCSGRVGYDTNWVGEGVLPEDPR